MSDDVSEQELPDLAAVEADLNAVGRALQRLDDGSYGQCTVCGEALAPALLEAHPLTEHCEAHVDGDRPTADGAAQTAWESGGVASS